MLPPSRHIGATNLSQLLRKIEDNIKSNAESGSIMALTKETLSEFEVIRDLLNDQIAKIN
jgi:hypothetical protein